MNRHFSLFAPLAFGLALPGCSATQDYPSLARRDVERITGTALPADPQAPAPEQATPEQPAPVDAGTQARLASLLGQARAAHQRFAGQHGEARRLVAQAGGAGVGDESWSVALAALAGLESARNQASIALAEVDGLYAAERLAHYEDETGNVRAMAAARETITAWLDEQNRTIDALARQLGV